MPEDDARLAQPGEVIARGRAADVFAYRDGLVLRRYRSDHDCVYEAAVMQHVRAHGYPAPEVVEVAGRDLVMERLDGPTMLASFSKNPTKLFAYAKTLADLLHSLHDISPAEWMQSKHPEPRAVVHLDLHPDNVMLTSRGPVVIDWSNAGLGDPDVEVADLWLVMSCAKPPANLVDRLLIGAGRRIFVNALIGHFDRSALRAKLPRALEGRSRDRNMSEAELGRMRRLVERYAI
jgi:aminoglycoside phosphotransferase (APT) family kinase protein